MSEQYWGCSDKMSEANFSPAETLFDDVILPVNEAIQHSNVKIERKNTLKICAPPGINPDPLASK